MIFWLWQARLFQPKIRICPALADYTHPEDPAEIPRCEFTLINQGKRAAADLAISAYAVVPGLTGVGDRVWLRLRDERLPWTGAGASEQYFLYISRIPEEDKKAYAPWFPEPIARALAGDGPEVSVRDFLAICENATIEVVVAANDSVFGGRSFKRHVFQHNDFRSDHDTFVQGVTCGYDRCCQASRLPWHGLRLEQSRMFKEGMPWRIHGSIRKLQLGGGWRSIIPGLSVRKRRAAPSPPANGPIDGP